MDPLHSSSPHCTNYTSLEDTFLTWNRAGSVNAVYSHMYGSSSAVYEHAQSARRLSSRHDRGGVSTGVWSWLLRRSQITGV
jgi:hypothetical protein